MALTIRTQNLIIRQFSEADLVEFATYRAIPAVAEFQTWSNFTYEDAIATHSKMTEVPFGTVGSWFQLAIKKGEAAPLAGDLAVHFLDEQQVEIGFTVAPSFQRTGIAHEAMLGLLGHIFTIMSKHRAIAVTDTRNVASCGLLEKLGFRREAHHVDNIFFKGAWGSEYVYAILRSEWKAKQT
jgi:RimJ/RimL family protein N-acetyltransferase